MTDQGNTDTDLLYEVKEFFRAIDEYREHGLMLIGMQLAEKKLRDFVKAIPNKE